MKWLMPAALAVALAAVIYATSGTGAGLSLAALDDTAPAPDEPPSDDYQQTTTAFQDAIVNLSPSTYVPADVAPDQAATNTRAFLDMLAYSEGTSGPDGYRTLFGGGLFDSYADHPRRVFAFTNSKGQRLTTTAAGRYQFLMRTWDELQGKLGLPDFGPDSQDAAALELVRQRGALADVQAGRIATACSKCAPIWASLPGAGYSQPERKLSSLIAAYQASAGTLEA